MQYLVSSVSNMTGVSKKTGNPFSMCRCTLLVPFSDTDSQNFQNHGIGLQQVEISVSDSFYKSLFERFVPLYESSNGMPVYMDLKMNLDREGRNVVIGFEESVVKLKTATDAKQSAPNASGSGSMFGKAAAA